MQLDIGKKSSGRESHWGGAVLLIHNMLVSNTWASFSCTIVWPAKQKQSECGLLSRFLTGAQLFWPLSNPSLFVERENTLTSSILALLSPLFWLPQVCLMVVSQWISFPCRYQKAAAECWLCHGKRIHSLSGVVFPFNCLEYTGIMGSGRKTWYDYMNESLASIANDWFV